MRSAYEYRVSMQSSDGGLIEREIDYVNPFSRLAVEFTINSVHKECFDLLDCEGEPYKYIKLSRSIDTSWKSEKGRTMRCVPYYQFLYYLSTGGDPVAL